MYLTPTHQLLRLFRAELNKRTALRAVGDRTGIPAVRSGVRIRAGGKSFLSSPKLPIQWLSGFLHRGALSLPLTYIWWRAYE
jgi:hypothetical protein